MKRTRPFPNLLGMSVVLSPGVVNPGPTLTSQSVPCHPETSAVPLWPPVLPQLWAQPRCLPPNTGPLNMLFPLPRTFFPLTSTVHIVTFSISFLFCPLTDVLPQASSLHWVCVCPVTLLPTDFTAWRTACRPVRESFAGWLFLP